MPVLANIVQPLIDINEAILRFWHNDVGLSWGASIIGLTAVIRLLILPLTFKQVRSMQALQRLQPQMKEIQKRFKEDKKRQQEEMMKFYREHEVNPLGSCLPLILQIPFFIGLYQTLRSAHFKAEVGANGQFFFIPDITEPLKGHTAALITMLVLYVGTQLLSSYVSSFSVQDKNQRRLLFLFPFLFVPVVINFEAGLLIYWVTTNVWTIGQQLFIRRFLPPPTPALAGAGGKTVPSGARAAIGSGGEAGSSNGADEARPVKKKERGSRTATASKARSDDGNGNVDGGPKRPPPRSPRKKKKRSGRRR